MSTIAVIVATYGDEGTWGPLASRAAASADAQSSPADEIVVYHGATLATARNAAARLAGTDWLVFCDADDTLDAGYLAAMRAALELHGDAPALFQPATLGVHPDGREDPYPVVIAPRGPNLLSGNHMVIGTMCRRDQILAVGGFKEWPAWEDWDLWTRAWADGAALHVAADAVYRVGVRPDGRNALDPATARRLFAQMRATLEPLAKAGGVA